MNNPLVQPDPGLYIWTILTFLVLLGLLAKFAWNPLLANLKKREEMIRESVQGAERVQAELERIQREAKEVIFQARREAESIVAQGKSVAEKTRQEIVLKAKEQASAILIETEKQIGAEKDKAIAEIRGEVVNLSLLVASKLIHKNLSAEDNQAVIEDSLRQIRTTRA